MAFTETSSTVITQNAGETDDGLSGLSTIAGVTITTVGIVSIYDIGDRQLTVAGTLNHDPEREILLIGDGTQSILHGVSIISGGRYNFGNSVTPPNPENIVPAPTGNRFSRSTGLIIKRPFSPNPSGTIFGINVLSGGRFDWNGGTIESDMSLSWAAGSTVNVNEAVILLQDGDNTTGSANLIRCNAGSGATINGLVKIGGSFQLQGGDPSTFAGYQPIHSNNSVGAGRTPFATLFRGGNSNPSSTNTLATQITVTDYQGTGNVREIAVLDLGHGRVRNSIDGINTTFGQWLTTNRFAGRVEFTRQLQFNVSDLATGSNVEGSNLFIRDVNNNNRQTLFTLNDTADNTYVSTSAANGVITAEPIIKISQGRAVTNADPLEDIRTNAATGELLATIYDYNYQKREIQLDTSGNGVLTTTVALTPDANVSEQDAAVAGAYTQFVISGSTITVSGTGATLDMLYDYVKYWNTRAAIAGQGNTVQAVESAFELTANGTTLDLNNFVELVLNGELASGTKFTTLDLNGAPLSGTEITEPSGLISNLNITGNSAGQNFANLTNVEINSVNTYSVHRALDNVTLRGSYNLDGATVTFSATNPSTLDATLNNLTDLTGLFDFGNTVFTSTFSATAGSGTGLDN